MEPNELHQPLLVLHQQLWSTVIDRIKEELSDTVLLARIRQRFEDHFRYNAEGLPRVWQKGVDIDTCFREARDSAEQLISLFAEAVVDVELVELPPPSSLLLTTDSSNRLVFLSVTRRRDLVEKFKRDANILFLEAKRSAVSTFSEIPRGMWLLLLVFGFNEIMSVLSFILASPLLFMLTLAVVVVGMFLYQSGLLVPLMRGGMTQLHPHLHRLRISLRPSMQRLAMVGGNLLHQLSGQSEDSNSPSPQNSDNHVSQHNENKKHN